MVASDLRPLAGSKWLHAAGGGSIFSHPRQDQYFAVSPHLRAPYLQAARYVHDLRASRVGLASGGNSFEYPMWVLLKEQNPSVDIVHIGVTTASRRFATRDRVDVVICLEPCATAPPGMLSAKDFEGVRVWSR